MKLTDNITCLKGVGNKVANAFLQLKISTIEDLLMYLPRGFEVYEKEVEPTEELEGTLIAVRGKVLPNSHRLTKKKNLSVDSFRLRCADIDIAIAFFNMPYIAKSLKAGRNIVVRGILKSDRFGLNMSQPKVYSPEEYEELIGAVTPIYRTIKGLGNTSISKFATQAIDSIELGDDYLDTSMLNRLNMYDFSTAIRRLHSPKSLEDYISARRRLAFQEFFRFILQIRGGKEVNRLTFDRDMIEVADTNRLIERLPYKLTGAQTKTWKEISEDMTSGLCMNRLVQGDVGSGKTILAYLALLMNASNGYQGCLMAPTEVLAMQHYEGLKAFCEEFTALRPVILIGSQSAKTKREIYEMIRSGDVNVIIGTHALIQEAVSYKDLTLVITDEQHRFGVNQRKALAEKSDGCHVLVMSATPIPRTLSMIMYGDLSISVMDEMPANRIPIKNAVTDSASRERAYITLRKEIEKGHQAYIICPMVEEGAMEDVENVVDYTEKLRESMGSETRIDYVHGRMKAIEKNAIMDRFKMGDIDILVSTTVIEVGINVPNATVMIIENADRFGLAALHQLRGRVGRGKDQSYCIFISGSKSKTARERLDILTKYNDGFKIADEDLRLRGPGDMFGIRQSGDFDFEIADIYKDADILRACSEYIDWLLRQENSDQMIKIKEYLNHFSYSELDVQSI